MTATLWTALVSVIVLVSLVVVALWWAAGYLSSEARQADEEHSTPAGTGPAPTCPAVEWRHATTRPESPNTTTWLPRWAQPRCSREAGHSGSCVFPETPAPRSVSSATAPEAESPPAVQPSPYRRGRTP